VNGEECDTTQPNDGCTSNCTVIEGWVCMTENLTSLCSQVCGDGYVTKSEQCDDGNLSPNDGKISRHYGDTYLRFYRNL
jgi:hypothetical protein